MKKLEFDECVVCVEKFKSDRRYHRKQRFCSLSCAGKARGKPTPPSKVCPCGEVFQRPEPYHSGDWLKKKTCSRACSNRYFPRRARNVAVHGVEMSMPELSAMLGIPLHVVYARATVALRTGRPLLLQAYQPKKPR